MLKRILLVVLTNILVILTITIVVGILSRVFGINLYGGGYASLFLMCFVWGMGGAFISLAMSRFMAKWMMGVHVIDPNNAGEYQSLVNTVHNLAQKANLAVMPEVGVYESPEVNAFATGPSKSKSLVAVSTGLLQRMNRDQIEGVLGHEMAHISNGDMVTMTLVQGVINAFVMFFARIVAFAISTALRSRDNDRGGSFWMNYLLISVLEVVFGLLGFIVVARFSRWREFRADRGGAEYAGRGKMISALQQLQNFYGKVPEAQQQGQQGNAAVATLKISGKQGGFLSLMATHPPLEERIARLQAG